VQAEYQGLFQLVERSSVRETLTLEKPALLSLLQGTYRGMRRGVSDRVSSLTTMSVTLASELLLFHVGAEPRPAT